MNISTLSLLQHRSEQAQSPLSSHSAGSTLNTRHSALDNPSTPEEAANKFEKILVEQFVNVMTEQLFKSNLSGEDGPGWMKAYGDTQRKVLTEVLSDHLVDNGTFNISETVLQQWKRNELDTGI